MTESRSYDLTGFDSIESTTGIRAIVTTGGDYAVRVEARDKDVLDRLDVSVNGGKLHLGLARNFVDFVFGGGLVDMLRFGGDFGITAYITLPTLNGAEASSGARLEASNVKSDRFRADASSGGELLLLSMSAGEIRANVSSGARIEFEGVAGEFDAATSSGGNLRAEKLAAEHGRLDASSGGNLEANITARLRANASSGGNIRVTGNPTDRDTNSSSGGNIAIR